ncbi:MAG: hypothetical protein QOD74_102, partial [Variibacter sp.]|nr:hypothetical protein [Variibacter sp.]
GATANASRAAREAYASVPADVPELDRIEPRIEPEGLRPGPPPHRARPRPEVLDDEPPAYDAGPEPQAAEPRGRPGPMPRRPSYEHDDEKRASRKGLIAAILSLLIIAGLGATAYWQRERISALFGVVRNLAPQASRDPTQTRPKVEDRIGQPGQQAGRQQQGTRPGAQTPVVAQRVVLYEEDPANPEGQRHVGSSLWRTETVSPGPGLSPELAVRADVEVPERRLAMTMSIRRNTDQSLPASHTIEIMFNLPADFPFGGVANVPGLLMKESEQTRGSPLSGLAVKVTNNFFLVGLSSTEADLQRNLALLKDRAWFDIPIVYGNGRRAILAVEKGTPGDRAFTEAFGAWAK